MEQLPLRLVAAAPIGARVAHYAASIELGDGENHPELWEFLAMLTALSCWMDGYDLDELRYSVWGQGGKPRECATERRAA